VKNSEKIKAPHSFTARVGLLSIARIVQVLVTFLVFWLYTIRLTKDQYGNFQKVFVVAGFASALITLGLPLLIASLPAEKVPALTRQLFFKNIRYYAVLFGALTIFVFFSFSFISYIAKSLLVLLAVINACYITVEIMVLKFGRDNKVFLANILYAIFFGVIHYAALQKAPFSMTFLLSLLVILSFARLAWLFLKHIAPVLSEDLIDEEVSRIYQRQWLLLSLNEAFEAFSKYVDRIFLLWLLTAQAFAVYFNGAYEIPLLAIFISVSGTFITVQAKQQDMGDQGILSLFYISCIQLSFLLFPMFFFFQLNAYTIFNWLFLGKYNESVPIFLVTCWIIPFRIVNYTAILQTKLKSELIFQGSLIGFAAKLVLCFPLYSFWGSRGVALAVLIGTILQMIYYLTQTAHLLTIKKREMLPIRSLFIIFMISGGMLYIFQKMSSSWNSFNQILAGISGMAIAVVIFILFRKIFLAASRSLPLN